RAGRNSAPATRYPGWPRSWAPAQVYTYIRCRGTQASLPLRNADVDDRGHQRTRRPCPVRVLRLPGIPELGDRALLAVRNEDRVVAEALAPAALLDDP